VRLHTPAKCWPAAEWAVVESGQPPTLIASGRIQPPRSYDEAAALRHLLEAVVTAVREHQPFATLVWQIEGNAKMNTKMRPRLRAEGVVCAASAISGATTALVGWPEIASRANAAGTKDDYERAALVCGVGVGGADARAVLVAVAALRG
jgi:hypothetical protein